MLELLCTNRADRVPNYLSVQLSDEFVLLQSKHLAWFPLLKVSRLADMIGVKIHPTECILKSNKFLVITEATKNENAENQESPCLLENKIK